MSKKSPWLYHFHVPIEVSEKIEIDPIKDEDGNEIQQFKTIKKEKPFKCAIKKPNRAIYEEGELFYSVEVSKYIQAGMLTKTLLAKRFANDGGTLTSHDQEHYAKLYSLLHTKEQEIQRIQLDTDNAKKRAKRLQALIVEITSIRQQLVEFESTQSALFDQTAEHKARNRTILWWVLNLSYIKDKDDEAGKEVFKPLFEGEKLEDKLGSYDAIEEDEDCEKGGPKEHFGLALKKFAYFVAFWYSGQATDKEGFKAAEELLDEVDVFGEHEEDDTPNIFQEQRDAAQEALEEEVEEILSPTNETVVDPEETEIKLSDINKAEEKEPKAEEPKAEEPKAEEPKAEEPKAEEPKAEEPKDIQ